MSTANLFHTHRNTRVHTGRPPEGGSLSEVWNISKKKSAAYVTFLKKRVEFFPLWPLWPLWCLRVAFLEKRRCVVSSMKKKAKFIEECTLLLFSREATERHQRGQRGQRGKNAMPFFQKGHRGRIWFLLMKRGHAWHKCWTKDPILAKVAAVR